MTSSDVGQLVISILSFTLIKYRGTRYCRHSNTPERISLGRLLTHRVCICDHWSHTHSTTPIACRVCLTWTAAIRHRSCRSIWLHLLCLILSTYGCRRHVLWTFQSRSARIQQAICSAIRFFADIQNVWMQVLTPSSPLLPSGKRNVTVWRPSVCLSRRHTGRDSPGSSMRRGQRTFWPDNKEDRHITCIFFSRLREKRDELWLGRERHFDSMLQLSHVFAALHRQTFLLTEQRTTYVSRHL